MKTEMRLGRAAASRGPAREPQGFRADRVSLSIARSSAARPTRRAVAMFAAGVCLFASPVAMTVARAQVVLTEVQPNPSGTDDSEWIEIQNIGPVGASIEGFVLQDFGPTSPRRYAFPPGSTLGPQQVILLARSASSYELLAASEGFSRPQPDYEFAEGDDDPGTPNLVVTEGSSAIQLANGGDAVALYDAAGAFVSGIEWVVDRAEIPGAPFPGTAGSGESLRRIGLSGNSADDFEISPRPTPGEGMGATSNRGPLLSDAHATPNVLFYGETTTFEVSATDLDGVHSVVGYFALANTPNAPTSTDFIDVPLAADAAAPGRYQLSGTPEIIFPGLVGDPPTGFHDRYLRYYFQATDALGAATTLPANASPTAGSSAFFWDNVLPAGAIVTIAAARQQDASHILLYDNHAVRVDAIVTSAGDAFSTARTDFFVRDLEGADSIHVYSRTALATSLLPGDIVRITGRLSSYADLRQIGDDPRSDAPTLTIESLGTTTSPEPRFLTIAELLLAPEDLESQLVGVHDAELVAGPGQDLGHPPTVWPSGDTVYIVDGTGTLAVRISAGSQIAGAPTPTGRFDLSGIFGQFSPGAPVPETYQILPRGLSDIALPQIDSDGGVAADAETTDADVADADVADADVADADVADADVADADVADADAADADVADADAADTDVADADVTDAEAADAGGSQLDVGTPGDAAPPSPALADAGTSSRPDATVGGRDALSWGASSPAGDDEGGCSCGIHRPADAPPGSNGLDLLFLTLLASAVVIRRGTRRFKTVSLSQ
ncbi:MAG: lamin tail domain-containing protein [Deltaproteobacteria bacterium]|nr:lamin tail domain-containing protein [Deltaproteobacteria bacterium]